MAYNFNIRIPLAETREYLLSLARNVARNPERVCQGLDLAEMAHAGQLRGDDEPYIVHPIRTALLLAEAAHIDDSDMWIAALLHDTLEDSTLGAERIHEVFGSNVYRLVIALTRTKPLQETAAGRRDGKIAKWRVTMQADADVRLLKVCDNLDNVLSWKFISERQAAYAKIPRWLMEAEELYLPLAAATNQDLFGWMRREIDAYYQRGLRAGTWFTG